MIVGVDFRRYKLKCKKKKRSKHIQLKSKTYWENVFFIQIFFLIDVSLNSIKRLAESTNILISKEIERELKKNEVKQYKVFLKKRNSFHSEAMTFTNEFLIFFCLV
jgi:hypothetical protein